MNWQRVRAEFERLCDLPRDAADAALAELTRIDPVLAGQVRELLAQDAAAGSYLERAVASGPAPGIAAAGLRLGRFELVRPLGAGGMGAVWEARQADPERRVAIKLVVRDGRSERERWRFLHEVRLLAQLRHPAIATLYEAGEDDVGGTVVSWFAMELVDGGRDLLTWVRDRQLPRAERLSLFERLCEAVEHGHRRGVLHRDLKPSNVLVDRDGRLQLIDFGIARAIGADAADTTRTAAGELVGTLHYMAPEQLRGETAAIGTAADVYALGVILYHLLGDRPPFDLDGVPFARVAEVVLEREPRPLPEIVPDLPRDLGFVVQRALAKDPTRRYPTPRDLVLDLQRWRRHEPVSARAPSLGYRTRKLLRRHRVAVAVLAAIGFGLAVGGYGLWHGAETARARERAAVRANEVSRAALRVVADLFDGIDDTGASRELTVHELLADAELDRRALREPVVEQALREIRGRAFARLRRYPEALVELERAAALQAAGGGPVDGGDAVAVRAHGHALAADLGRVLVRTGDRDRGVALLRDAVAATADGACDDETRRRIVTTWCRWLADENAAAELLPAAEELRALAARTGNDAAAMLAEQRLAQAATGLGRHDLAIAASERGWQLARQRFGERHRVTCGMLHVHVASLQLGNRLDAAEALYPSLIDTARAVFGDGSPNLLKVLNNHVHLLTVRGRNDAAIDSLRAIVAAYDARGGAPTPEHVTALHNLGQVLSLAERFAEAEPHLQRAAAATREVFGPDDRDAIWMRFNLGACLAGQRRWAEAEPILLGEYERLAAVLGEAHEDLRAARSVLAQACLRNELPERAAEWRR